MHGGSVPMDPCVLDPTRAPRCVPPFLPVSVSWEKLALKRIPNLRFYPRICCLPPKVRRAPSPPPIEPRLLFYSVTDAVFRVTWPRPVRGSDTSAPCLQNIGLLGLLCPPRRPTQTTTSSKKKKSIRQMSCPVKNVRSTPSCVSNAAIMDITPMR